MQEIARNSRNPSQFSGARCRLQAMALRDPYSAEVRRVVELLAYGVRQKGLSRRALEEKMGMSRGYLSELLSGDVDLRISYILMILEALEIHPWQFFRVAFNRPQLGRSAPVPEASAEEELLAVMQQGLQSPLAAADEREIDRVVKDALLRILSRPEPAMEAESAGPGLAPTAPENA